ncbi:MULTISPECIES: hypothetical protein [unclassified Mesorhizobium]|uniref:hypothetical protein n=1 Tax=unclassified Mesorhizobium TaxID=325217 RepID=UPI00167C232F|nr:MULTISPECIES: hypothetical protein [unclassified Mesorhizobium]
MDEAVDGGDGHCGITEVVIKPPSLIAYCVAIRTRSVLIWSSGVRFAQAAPL